MGKATPADPTGQKTNRKVATRKVVNRLHRAERRILGLFRAIPKKRIRRAVIANAETATFYEYDYPVAARTLMALEIQYALNDQLLDTQFDEMPFDWYAIEDINRSARQGALEETRDFNQMTAAAVAAGLIAKATPAIEPEQVVFTDEFRDTTKAAQMSAFHATRTISDKTAAQVLQRINAGIKAGSSPIVVSREIKGRFAVATSSARRTMVTEVNEAYNNAKMDATRILGKQTGLRPAVIHVSALLPTTRPHHAARHGNAYTLEDQLSWWEQGANRVNCHCTTRSVLIDRKGQVMQGKEQDAITTEGKKFFQEG